jgi:GMP synthase (glutamine-hydrolysing)
MPIRPIVIVRNEDPDPGGTVVEELRTAGLPVSIVDAHHGGTLPDTADVAGVVIFGGSQHADDYDGHPYLRDERQLAQEATERGLPVLGICLGGQILAMAMGAPLRPSPVREFGFTEVLPTAASLDDQILCVWRPGDRVFHWHEDTFDLPDGATLLMEGEHVTNQAFRYGDRAWGLQFHPEVTKDVIEGWLGVAGETEVTWGKSHEQIRQEIEQHLAKEERRAREMIRRFGRVVSSSS